MSAPPLNQPLSRPDPTLPVGMFDSGVGGFTVFRELKKVLPNEPVVYYGDTANIPYGDRDPRLIRKWAKNILAFLLQKNVKAIAIACNISSSVLTAEDLAQVPVPVFGLVYNGAAAALQATKNSRIGVIATAATVETGSYVRTIRSFNPRAEVTQSACPKFVPFTESGVFHGNEVDKAVREYIAPLKEKGVDTVIYGCTHYPLLEQAITKHLDGVQMIDPAVEIVEELAAYLHTNDLLHSATRQDDMIYASDLNEHFFSTAELFLHRDIRPLTQEVKLNLPEQKA